MNVFRVTVKSTEQEVMDIPNEIPGRWVRLAVFNYGYRTFYYFVDRLTMQRYLEEDSGSYLKGFLEIKNENPSLAQQLLDKVEELKLNYVLITPLSLDKGTIITTSK